MARKYVVTGLIGFLVLLILGGIGYFAYSRFFGGSGTLTVWTIQGNEAAIKTVAQLFSKQNPSYKVKIVPVPEQVYEIKSLYALATQQGSNSLPAPDVWIIPNEWIPFHRNKLAPAPDGVLDSGVQDYEATRPKGTTPPAKPERGRSNTAILQKDYAPAVAQDLVSDSKAWGVPLAMDTLALYYDRTKISTPPKTWNDVVDATKRFTVRTGDTVTRSAVALGDIQTVPHSLDILSLLMLQNGVDMIDEKDAVATFNVSKTGTTSAGAQALDFFTSFARPGKETYTWNKSLGTSLQALNKGSTLMAFGYLGDSRVFGDLSKSKIAVAPMPQVNTAKPQTYGRYLAATVTKQAAVDEKTAVAWDFVKLFANPDISERYAQDIGLAPARSDVAKRFTSLAKVYQPFLDQVPLATNWQKQEVSIADGAFVEALALLAKGESAQVALDVAAKAYTTYLQAPNGLESDPEILSFWQAEDDPTDYRELIKGYVTDTPTIKRMAISVHTRVRFEWEMLNAMAARLGPDLVLLPNDTITRYAPTLRPLLPGKFNLSGGRLDDITALERTFAPAVAQDVVVDTKIYAMPAHVETLMLAVNQTMVSALLDEKSRSGDQTFYETAADLFSAGPKLWSELETMAAAAVGRTGPTELSRPFLALGTGNNVEHTEDLYALLVKQFGGEITDPDRRSTGIHLPFSSQNPVVAGEQAKNLLQGFADPQNDHYTWDKTFPNSIEALADGKVMAAFIYPRDLKKIQVRNPQANLRYFLLPQLQLSGAPLDIASYYALALPLSGKKPNEAIGFIQYAVLDSSLDSFVSPVKSGPDTTTVDRVSQGNVQLSQRNTAQSYYKGMYPEELDQAFRDVLDNRLSLEQAAAKINASLQKTFLGE